MLPENDNRYFGKDLEAMAVARNYYDWIVSEISPFLGQTVAEVGAGCGHLSKLLLKSERSHVYAFEPSPNMFGLLQQAVRSEPRVTAVRGVLRSYAAGVLFDTVIYINVLEHVCDDAAELKTAFQVLAPGGFLIVFAPALKGLYSDFDRQIGHFRRYSRKELKNLVERSGFTIINSKYFDFAGILPWFLHFVLFKGGMKGGEVSLYDKLVIPLVRILESRMPPLIGKNVLCVAKKPRLVNEGECDGGSREEKPG